MQHVAPLRSPTSVASAGARQPAKPLALPLSGLRLDLFATACSVWMTVGLTLDGWAHEHNPSLESFFTPWHAVLYSGYFAWLALLGVLIGRGRARGLAWRQAVPVPYHLSLLGAAVFLAAGFGDMVWHTLLGIERGIEGLLSPTHMALALGAALLFSSPVRAAWHRPVEAPHGWRTLVLMLVSLGLVLCTLTFFIQYLDPFVESGLVRGAPPFRRDNIEGFQARLIGGIILQTLLLVGPLLLLLRRWSRLPFGSVTLLFMLPTLMLSLVHTDFIGLPVALPAGLVADGLLRWLRPTPAEPDRVRLFAALVPLVVYSVYFAAGVFIPTGQGEVGVWWSVPVWSGAIAIAGCTGWLLSYLAVPPAQPGGRSVQ